MSTGEDDQPDSAKAAKVSAAGSAGSRIGEHSSARSAEAKSAGAGAADDSSAGTAADSSSTDADAAGPGAASDEREPSDSASAAKAAPHESSVDTAPAAADIAQQSADTAPEAPAAEAAKEPKLVRRVVCSYRLGWLPGDWLQTWRRLDRVFARANLRVKATLAPLEDLPEDTDILVVPPDLREDARNAVKPGTPILVTPASAAAGAFAELVKRLEAGTDFTAERIDPEEEKDKPKIVNYRGHTLLD